MSHDSHKRRASDEEDEEDKQPHKKHATTRVDSEASAHMNSMSAMDDEKPIGEEDTLPSSSSSSAAAASSSSAATALPPAVDFSLVHTEQLRQWAEPLLGAELFSVPDLFLLPPSVLLYIRASAVDDVPVMHVYVIKCMGLHQTLFDDLLSSDGPPITPKYREHALWEQICMAIDREVTTVDSVSVEMISSSSSSSSIVQLKSSSSPVWANVVVLLLRASEGGVSTQRACYTPPADGDIRPLLNAFRRMILDEQNDLGFWSYLHGAELELANASGSVPAIPSLDEAAALSASTASSSTRRELRSELAPCEADCLFQHLTMHASPMQQVEQFFAKFRLEMDPCFRGQWRRHIMRALQEQHGDGAAAAAGGAGAASSSSSSATIAPVARHQFQVDPSVLSVIFQLNSPLASLLVPHVLASSLFSPLDQVEGNTALHLAAAARDVAAVRALLQYGAFEIINLPNARRQTPLHCMMLGHTSRQQQLMQAHSLTLAPRERDLRHLLQAKADVNAASASWCSPFQLSATLRYVEFFRLLHSYGGDLRAVDRVALLVEFRGHQHVHHLREFLDAGVISLLTRHDFEAAATHQGVSASQSHGIRCQIEFSYIRTRNVIRDILVTGRPTRILPVLLPLVMDFLADSTFRSNTLQEERNEDVEDAQQQIDIEHSLQFHRAARKQ